MCTHSMITDTKLRKALGKKREEIEVVSDSHGLNARISQARQMIAYQHALAHIMRNDFGKTDADEIERAM